MAKKPQTSRNRQKSAPRTLGADDEIQGSVTPSDTEPPTTPEKQPETSGKQAATTTGADQPKHQNQAQSLADQYCPRCSNHNRRRREGEQLVRVKCELVRDGLSWMFVCPTEACSYRIPGPPNVAMTEAFKRIKDRQHPQHNVRDYQK